MIFSNLLFYSYAYDEVAVVVNIESEAVSHNVVTTVKLQLLYTTEGHTRRGKFPPWQVVRAGSASLGRFKS